MRLVGYTRVSTREQVDSGLGLEAQRATVEMAAALRGARIVSWQADEGISGSRTDRPGLLSALRLIRDGEADGIIAAKLDRLSRSSIHAMELIRDSNAEGWTLICVDLGLDTSTPIGKFTAGIMATVAELERDMISERTKAAMAAKKARGESVGRPREIDQQTRDLIWTLRSKGLGWKMIATELQRLKLKPPRGQSNTWATSTIRRICEGSTCA